MRRNPSSYRIHIRHGKSKMAEGEGCIMIDSVVWAQYINVTDSHVAIAIAAPPHCVGRQKHIQGVPKEVNPYCIINKSYCQPTNYFKIGNYILS